MKGLFVFEQIQNRVWGQEDALCVRFTHSKFERGCCTTSLFSLPWIYSSDCWKIHPPPQPNTLVQSPSVIPHMLFMLSLSEADFSARLSNFLPVSGALFSSKPCVHQLQSLETPFLLVLFLFYFISFFWKIVVMLTIKHLFNNVKIPEIIWRIKEMVS